MKVKLFICFALFSILISFMLSSCFIFDEMKMDKARERLKKEGTKADATVLSVEDLNETVNNNPRIKITLEEMPEGQPTFRAEVKMVVSRVNIPRSGDLVTVYFNPNDKTDIAVE
jgi:hypothetical protein